MSTYETQQLEIFAGAAAPSIGDPSSAGIVSHTPTSASKPARGERRSPAAPVSPAVEALLTFAQAARSPGVSLRQFRRLVDAGELAFVRMGARSPRVRPSELHRFLEASAVKYSEVRS